MSPAATGAVVVAGLLGLVLLAAAAVLYARKNPKSSVGAYEGEPGMMISNPMVAAYEARNLAAQTNYVNPTYGVASNA
jgi:hypothetical protein